MDNDKKDWDKLPEWFQDPFEQGWKDYVKEMKKNNARSNRRLYKLLTEIKGASFVDSIKRIATDKKGIAMWRVSRKAEGVCLKDNRFSGVSEIWLNQKQMIWGATGEMYIQVKFNRFIFIDY